MPDGPNYPTPIFLKLAPAIRTRIAAIDTSTAVNRFLTLDQIRDRAAWRERFFAVLVARFSAFALALAAVGLYAMLSYVVTLQQRAIGIRIARVTRAVRRPCEPGHRAPRRVSGA